MISETSTIYGFFTACAFFLGCCIGSFMNVVVWRLPRGESLVYPPSHCPKCNHRIRAWENIPIISWLCLRARCSSCHQPISIKYPIGEAITGLLFAGIWLRIVQLRLPLEVTPGFFYLVASLLAAALIDIEHHIIPDEITYSGIVVALMLAIALPAGRVGLSDATPVPIIYTGFHSMIERAWPILAESRTFASVMDCALGILFGIWPLLAIGFAVNLLLPHNRNGYSAEAAIGGGDVKLMAMAGAFLGADIAVKIVLLASAIALIWAICILPFRKLRKSRLPFAPFIGVATFWLINFSSCNVLIYYALKRLLEQ